jgi:RIO kinase 1
MHHDPLAPLLVDGVIDEVVGRLKTGKEAELWLVRQGEAIVAAKVYKERHARSFKNNADYKEGRRVRDTRTQRAMDRGTRFGQAAAEEAWKTKESDALHALHAAGVRVPRPILFHEGVLLMEVVVDPDGHPAPRLVDAPIPREQAAALYADLRGQVVRMLGCDLIHGDLSPYNVLLGWDGPVVIDFPQVIGAAHNSRAEHFFERDLENLRRFFASIDPALGAAAGDAHEIWRAYVRRELTPDFVPTGRLAPPPRHGAGHAGHGQAGPGGQGAHRGHGGSGSHGGQGHGTHARGQGDGGGRTGPTHRPQREGGAPHRGAGGGHQGQPGPRREGGPRQGQPAPRREGGPQQGQPGPRREGGPQQGQPGPRREGGPQQGQPGPRREGGPQQGHPGPRREGPRPGGGGSVGGSDRRRAPARSGPEVVRVARLPGAGAGGAKGGAHGGQGGGQGHGGHGQGHGGQGQGGGGRGGHRGGHGQGGGGRGGHGQGGR